VPEVPPDAGYFPYNGQNIVVPPNANFETVYDAGVANGRFNIGGMPSRCKPKEFHHIAWIAPAAPIIFLAEPIPQPQEAVTKT